MRFLRLATRLAVLLVSFALIPAAHAKVNYTDTWEAAGSTEPGWGINFAHTGDLIFVTFYIYGQNRAPVWYTAQLLRTTGDTFTGKLYATTGTWFGTPVFTPVPPSDVVEVGDATFTAIDPTSGQLRYRVGTVMVEKNIYRFTTVRLEVGGLTPATRLTYLGGIRVTYSGTCPASQPASSLLPAQMGVVQSATNVVAFEFTTAEANSRAICGMLGNAVQRGSLLRAPTAQYVCANGLSTTGSIDSLRLLDDGIEAHWTVDLGGGCIETGRFAGVTQQ